jgi:hypothetical protein
VLLLGLNEDDSGTELRVMDFTHAFTWGEPLDRRLGYQEKIKDPRIYGLFPEFRKYIDRVEMTRCLALLDRFRREDANRIVATVPGRWDVNTETRRALSTFLYERAHFIQLTLAENLGLWEQQEIFDRGDEE